MTLEIYKRHLPHWRLEGATYFVTWRIHPVQRVLEPDERTVVMDSILHFNHSRYELSAYVVMDDHVHVLFSPIGDYKLENIVHSWKSFTANKIQRQCGRTGKIWIEEYFDRIIRNEDDFNEKADYTRNNPAKRWPGISDYKWVWVIGEEPR